MPTTITFRLVSIPDPPSEGVTPGTVVLDVLNTYTISDAEAQMMLAAFVAKYTPTPSRTSRIPKRAPTPDEAVTRAVKEIWEQLRRRFYKSQAGRGRRKSTKIGRYLK